VYQFPPTLYTNVQYTKGVRLFPSKEEEEDGTAEFVVPKNYWKDPHFGPTDAVSHQQPTTCLSPIQSVLWTQPYTAHYIAATTGTLMDSTFPNHTTRLLGTITRTLSLDLPHYSSNGASAFCDNLQSYLQQIHDNHQTSTTSSSNSFPLLPPPQPQKRNTSKKQQQHFAVLSTSLAQKMLQVEQRRYEKRYRNLNNNHNNNNTKSNVHVNSLHDEIATRVGSMYTAQRMQQLWIDTVVVKKKKKKQPNNSGSSSAVDVLPSGGGGVGWDQRSGDLLYTHVGTDTEYIQVTDLLHFLLQQQVKVEEASTSKVITATTATKDEIVLSPQDLGVDDNVGMFIKELITLLQACLELSNPDDGFWNIPLFTVYPVVVNIQPPVSPSSSSAAVSSSTGNHLRIQFGIYCHRLLIETFTTRSLEILLRAMDPTSYRVTAPICRRSIPVYNDPAGGDGSIRQTNQQHTSPQDKEEPMFVCAKYPIVCIHGEDKVVLPNSSSSHTGGIQNRCGPSGGVIHENNKNNHNSDRRDSNQTIITLTTDDEDDEEDRKLPATTTFISNIKSTTVTNSLSTATTCTATSEDDVDDDDVSPNQRQKISAYTTLGLLKLLEHEGVESLQYLSNWYPYYCSQMEPIMLSQLRLSLLLHQQYAVVWMISMEHLPNFGINSLLWEEREFLDGPHGGGSKYYVSTALGQIRLEPPETMKGGLLCDEMGLGMFFFR
jgi:hypothetical protein